MADGPDNLPPLPETLLERLRAQQAPASPVPEAMDLAILADARAAISRRRRMRKMILSAAALSAAACVALVWSLWPLAGSVNPNDLNRDGQVNIVDAYLLAKRRAAGDKAITPERIDQLAMLAVKVDAAHGGGSGGASP